MGIQHWETLCGVDLDLIFSYSTIKYVRILDRRLGLLKVFFTVLIASYVLIYQIWYEGGYLQPVPVNGYSRFTLQQPTVNDCDPRRPGCFNDFTKREELPYCLQSPLPYPEGEKGHCRYMDSIAVSTLMTDAIVIGTRGVERTQTLLCEDTEANEGSTCPLIYSQPVDNDRRFYIADIERFTLLMDHGVITAMAGLNGESRDMEGRIYVGKGSRSSSLCKDHPGAMRSPKGNKRATGAPCYLQPNKTGDGFDIMDVGVLLQASDVSLDDYSHNNRTYRESGATMMIEINYSNFWGWFLRRPGYVYKVSLVRGSEYRVYESFFEPYPTARTVLSLSGLHISTLHTGSLYGKSFNYFLIQLTTSLTLLAIANTVIDLLALYTLPDRDEYTRAKFETTEDFSDLRKAKSQRVVQTSCTGLASDEDDDRLEIEDGGGGGSSGTSSSEGGRIPKPQ